jgi:cytochrome c553
MKITTITVLLLASCTGQIGDSDPTKAGSATFNSKVDPMLRSQCASCHEANGAGPAFLGSDGSSDDYPALLANARVVGGFQPASALLLTKGPHAGASWWSADQISKITSWLTEEAEDYDPTAAGDIMAAWAGCMTLENWNDSKMAQWAQKQTYQGAACGGCHAEGEYGFHANPTNELMFDQQRSATGIGSFFQVSAATATPEVVPSFDKLRSKCSGANLHPGCAVDDQYVEYLDRFHKLTRSMMESGLCKEPGYYTPMTPPAGT